METTESQSLQDLMGLDTWTADEHRALMDRLAGMTDPVVKFRDLLADLEAANPSPKGSAALKIGIGRFILNRYREALEAFSEATDNKDRRYFAAQCYLALRQYDQALEELGRAKARGWDGPECDFLLAETHALAGDLAAAGKTAEPLCKTLGEKHPDTHYLRGLLAELQGQGETATEEYARARELETNHTRATFRLAYYLDLHGDEQEAMALYEECIDQPPVHTHALLNMAVLLEDDGEYEQAAHCLHRLLKACPNHPRAQLFLRDVIASTDMYYDEEQARRIAKHNAVLDIPVTDFELSVRARNCLKKMDILTLGDLVRTSEAELLGYKNFGETSLKEIKEMLAAKGLRLGLASEDGAEGYETENAELEEEDPEDATRSIPIDQIELSVRARRVLEQLNVHTIGELAQKSEAELMGQKNFGQTSLQEMRQRLTEHGLAFRDSQ
jgi:DNA-directed RNA polymerase subunit alpha